VPHNSIRQNPKQGSRCGLLNFLTHQAGGPFSAFCLYPVTFGAFSLIELPPGAQRVWIVLKWIRLGAGLFWSVSNLIEGPLLFVSRNSGVVLLRDGKVDRRNEKANECDAPNYPNPRMG
jgi:hypothetical protein